MARTRKTDPYRVKAAKAAAKGKVRHWHPDGLGVAEVNLNKSEVKIFMKRDAGEILAWKREQEAAAQAAGRKITLTEREIHFTVYPGYDGRPPRVYGHYFDRDSNRRAEAYVLRSGRYSDLTPEDVMADSAKRVEVKVSWTEVQVVERVCEPGCTHRNRPSQNPAIDRVVTYCWAALDSKDYSRRARWNSKDGKRAKRRAQDRLLTRSAEFLEEEDFLEPDLKATEKSSFSYR